MRNLSAVVGMICLFLLSSCATLYEFPIEVYQPAKVNLPTSFKTIALASRNNKYEADTLQNYYARGNKLLKDLKPENIDSIVVKSCFDSLSTRLEKQQRFERVSILPVTTFPKQYTKNINPPSKVQIQKIASETHADAIILLDMLSGFYSLLSFSEEDRCVAQVVTASMWTVYNPENNRILHHTTLIDTLYWDGLDENGNFLYSRIPEKRTAIAMAAGLTAVKYSKNLIPYWNQVNRQILSCNKEELQKATELAKMNKWDEASAIWDKYTNNSKKRYKIQALYNLAVAREMEGNIEGALELLSDAAAIPSLSTYPLERKSIRNYSLILAKRKIDIEKINAMGYEE